MKHFLLICFLTFSLFSYSQQISDLNKEKDNLLLLIENNNKLMQEYGEKRSDELTHIQLVDDQIEKRKKLIELYASEVAQYTKQINKLSFSLDSLEKEIFALKADYSKIIYQESLKKSEQNELLFILSASSFNESYRRFLFLKQYNEYRRMQSNELNKSKIRFDEIKQSIEERRQKVRQLMASAKSETQNLDKEMTKRQQRVQEFVRKESDLKKEIVSAEKRAKELEEKILVLVREEAARRSKQDDKLSADILNNKGLLPWPCKQHVITSSFGEHPHPLIESLVIRNNGIDINVFDDLDVFPVQSGVVSRIIMIPGSNASVIIRHGSVLTVYSNLAEVAVKKDEKVDRKTKLGKVFKGNGLNSSILHFELWNGEEKQNPEDWLSPM